MTNLQIDDVLGFGVLMRGVANEYKPKLLAAEVPHDPTALIASTVTTGDGVAAAKALAKAKDDEAQAKYALAEDAKQAYYNTLSSWCDAMSGTLGKTTPEGKRVLAIRANLKGRGPNPPLPPPTP